MFINIHTHNDTGQQIELVSRTFDDVLPAIFSFGIHPWEESIVDGPPLIPSGALGLTPVTKTTRFF